jgi:hypothetical protein
MVVAPDTRENIVWLIDSNAGAFGYCGMVLGTNPAVVSPITITGGTGVRNGPDRYAGDWAQTGVIDLL